MALAEDIEGHARLVRGHIILTVLKEIPGVQGLTQGPVELDMGFQGILYPNYISIEESKAFLFGLLHDGAHVQGLL